MENDSGTGRVRANKATIRREKNNLCMEPDNMILLGAIILRLELIVEAKRGVALVGEWRVWST